MSVSYLGDNNPDGVSVGNGITELVSVYGVTPVAQRANAAQSFVPSSTTVVSNATTSFAIGGSSTTWAFTTSSYAHSFCALVEDMKTALVNFGVIKGSA